MVLVTPVSHDTVTIVTAIAIGTMKAAQLYKPGADFNDPFCSRDHRTISILDGRLSNVIRPDPESARLRRE